MQWSSRAMLRLLTENILDREERIMAEWIEKSLGEIAEITKLAGFEFTKYIEYNNDGEVIALRALNLRNGELDLTDIKRISRKVSDGLTRSKIYKDDILLTYTGNGYGDCAIIEENDKYHLAPNICKIVPNKNVISPYYLYCYIRSKAFYNQMSNNMTGSGQPTIPMKTIRLLKIPVPELRVQVNIANMLWLLNQKIRNNKVINNNLEQQAQAIFKSWFVDFEPFNNRKPSDWSVSTLGNVSIMGAGGDKPQNVSPIKTDLYEYPIYSNGLSNEGLYGFTDKPKISEESVTVSARGTIGFVCLRHIPYVPIVRLVTLIPKTEIVSAKYLYLWLKQLHITGTGTTQQQLTVPDFQKTEILVPSQKIVTLFTATVEPIFEKIRANQNENEKLSSLRDTLLPKLMSGELDVSDTEI